MKIKITTQEFDNIINRIKDKYKVIAPVSIPYAGQYSDTEVTLPEKLPFRSSRGGIMERV